MKKHRLLKWNEMYNNSARKEITPRGLKEWRCGNIKDDC
jgi:hypothetical protein